jgi:serine/threonine protein phosphatase 1
MLSTMKGRLIAIGDVHGCHEEMEDLLTLLNPTADDKILFLGDLVNRGPDSHRCIEIARSIGAQSLLGNHELRLLRYRLTGDRTILHPVDHDTLKQLQTEDWNYLSSMHLYYHDEGSDTVFVHGGFLPDRPWYSQPASIVTRIQVVGPTPKQIRRADAPPNSPLWADLWKGPPFVVYGHIPSQEVIRRPWSLGIDTACAGGGKLTAYILPDKKIVQVPSRRVYYPSNAIKR